MFKRVISDKLLKNSSVVGLECFFHSNDKIEFRLVILKKEKEKISIQLSNEKIESEDDLLNLIPSSIPVIIVVNGNIIIHKKIQVKEANEENVILHKIFPNANATDFYLQKSELLFDSTCFISVIRKEPLDNLLAKLFNGGYFILHCSFGPFVIESITPFLTFESKTEDDILLSDYKLRILQRRIFDFELLRTNRIPLRSFEVEGMALKENLLIPFASAFEYFLEAYTFGANIPSVEISKEEEHQKNIFKLVGWSSIILFFLLLLLNFLVFDHYDKLKTKFQAEISLYIDQLKRSESLQAEIIEKEKFLESTGLLDASKPSFYADQIALELPASILLSDMNIQPIQKRMGVDEDKLFFKSKVIYVSGGCKKSFELNEWIKILKVRNWVKEISIANYSQDKDEGVGKFSLEIKIR